METPIYIALSRQETLRRQMDVIANNIANMNTTGYKSQRMLFLEYLEQPARGEKLSFVQDFGMMRDVRPGNINITNNQLDVALRSEGFFAVDTAGGARYTRGGAWQLNDQRQIVDVNGLPLLDEAGNRLTVPQNATEIRIKGDGAIETDAGPLGKLKIVDFDDLQKMEELGSGLFSTTQEERPVAAPLVVQGAVENSNVQPIVEMSQMIEVLRQYQSNQKIIDSEHERQQTAIRQLGRVA